VTAYAGLPLDTSLALSTSTVPKVPFESVQTELQPASHARPLWAALIARIYAVLPLIGPECGSEMQLIAFVNEAEPVRRIFKSVGEPTPNS